MIQKTLRGDRTAAAGKDVARATRRRRRIPRAGFFIVPEQKETMRKGEYDERPVRQNQRRSVKTD